MPNRILKESIRTSKSVNSLSDFDFRLWAYLITYVDDYGRGSADPEILKGFVFPRRKSVTEASIAKGLTDLATTGLINLYEVGGESYLCFPTWAEHQRVQQKRSKFPAPCESEKNTNPPYPTVTHRDPPPESISESESESISESESESISESVFPHDAEQASAPVPEAVIRVPLSNGDFYPVTRKQVDRWAELYPSVDVLQELRNICGWAEANPSRRKTKSGILRHINGWLSREQDRGRSASQPKGPAQKAAEKVAAASYDLAAEAAEAAQKFGKGGGG